MNNSSIAIQAKAKARTRVKHGIGLQDGVRPGEGEILSGGRFPQRKQRKWDPSGAISIGNLIGSGK